MTVGGKPVQAPNGTIPRLEVGDRCDIGYVWELGQTRGTFNVPAIVDETDGMDDMDGKDSMDDMDGKDDLARTSFSVS
jgi:hypothetical protein